MDIAGYLEEIRKVYASREATEHSYRPALQKLFGSIHEDAEAINEPKRSEGGMPDFVFQRDSVPFGWCEAKDIGKEIRKLKGYSKDQRKRYEAAYPNLIYTNGVDFEFIRDGESAYFVSIADYLGELGGLQPRTDEFARLEHLLRDFAERTPVTVTSANRLAKLMAAKAVIIKDEVAIALKEDPSKESDLYGQFTSFQDNLLPNLTEGEFADLYAETITYGMFAARYNDPTIPTFSRVEALELIPATNPFLRALFNHIAGPNLEQRLRIVLDDLVALFLAANPAELFKNFGKWTARNDPFVHFYENFLGEYNPKKRKARGVWYTPEPVVDFIVRAVDDVLKTEFGIEHGIASTERISGGDHDGEHRVQILDPATGTGTFLAKVVEMVHQHVIKTAPGLWQGYVEKDLIPRLHGFELLMASYTMCHLKLDLMLRATGYKPTDDAERLSVWLTNALEPAEEDIGPLFFQALRREAQGASTVKNKTPIMCIIGNPPYSGISQNMDNATINDLIEDYKYVDGVHFGERKHWLHDDYVKFIRMSEEMISQNPAGGVLGFITNHGYLDNPTFRGMRWHLLKTFDKIWVLDLHGNAAKREIPPDGLSNQNVFDIQQGVSILIGAKTGRKAHDALAEIVRIDAWGSRAAKYEQLSKTSVNQRWNCIQPQGQYFMFHEGDYRLEQTYGEGFELNQAMPCNVTGLVTARDSLVIDFEKASLEARIEDFRDRSKSDEETRNLFFGHKKDGKYPRGDTRGWKLSNARQAIKDLEVREDIRPIAYRPFDLRQIYYRSDMVDWGREGVFRHVADFPNLGLIYSRQAVSGAALYNHALVTPFMFDNRGFYTNKGISQLSPLYLYPDDDAVEKDAFAPTERTLNFDPKLYAEICAAAGIDPADTDMARQSSSSARGGGASEAGDGGDSPPARHDAESPLHRTASGPPPRAGEDFRTATGDARPSEVKVFDYIYGVLHSPDYRETFAEFLKIDFPRIPYPASAQVFRHVSDKGEALRRLHLMEAGAIGDTPYPFLGEHEEEDQANVVASGYPKHEGGHVWINKHQYFENVPATAWNFYIGGYQPAQKWLKDRKGRALSYEDAGHYQKIVKILLETDRIMQQIELPPDTGKREEG